MSEPRKATERKYALTKVNAGDYLLPSNDGQTIWRFRTYEDGPTHGLDWPRDRTLWGYYRWTGRGDLVDLEDWDHWEGWRDGFDRRIDAINDALGGSDA